MVVTNVADYLSQAKTCIEKLGGSVVYIVNNGAWQSAGTTKGRLVFNVSGSGKAYVSRAQVNLGYKVTDWSSFK